MPLKFHRLFAIAGLVTCSLAIVTTSAVAQERRVFARDEVWQANFRDRIREKIDERRANIQRVPVEAPAAPSASTASGVHTITVGGVQRSYILTVPASVGKGHLATAVFALHGAKGSGKKLQDYLGLDTVVERQGFIAVYPDGIENAWNDGRDGANKAVKNANPGDDEAFLKALAADLVARGLADPHRLYITGLSNGGFMSLRMACLGNCWERPPAAQSVARLRQVADR